MMVLDAYNSAFKHAGHKKCLPKACFERWVVEESCRHEVASAGLDDDTRTCRNVMMEPMFPPISSHRNISFINAILDDLPVRMHYVRTVHGAIEAIHGYTRKVLEFVSFNHDKFDKESISEIDVACSCMPHDDMTVDIIHNLHAQLKVNLDDYPIMF